VKRLRLTIGQWIVRAGLRIAFGKRENAQTVTLKHVTAEGETVRPWSK
jgi:hypothetical protein